MRVFSFHLPVRFLRGHYGRLMLTVVALACGVAQVSGNDLVSQAALQAFVNVIDTVAGRASLQISTGEGALFPEQVAATVAAVPGVELVVPVVSATAFTSDDSGELLAVLGFDVTNKRAVGVYELRNDEGSGFDDPKLLLPDAIVLTHRFADPHGLKIGDAIDLDTPRGRHQFRIRGLLDPHGVARLYQGNLIVMDRDGAEDAFSRPGLINRVDIVVDHDHDPNGVAAAIAAVLPPGLQVEAPSQRKADLHKVMRSFRALLSALDMVGIGAAFLIAFNGLSTVFEARAWQIGVLRAIGVWPRALWEELLKESLLLGVAGAVVGIPAGIGFAHILLPRITTAAALNSKVATPDAAVTVHLSSLILAAALGLVAALLGAALPAWRASRGEVVDTLRVRGTEQEGISSGARWLVRAVGAGATTFAIAMQVAAHSVAWGLLATALLVVGAALAARPLLDALRTPLLRACRWLAGPIGRFTAVHLARNPRRTALTIAMLGVGLGCVVWLWMVAQSFERSVIEVLTQAMRSDLVVSSSHIESGFLEAPVDESLLTELAAIHGVRRVVGDRVSDWHHGGGPIAIDAFDPVYFTDPSFGQWPLVGYRLPDVWNAVARGDAAIVSSNFVLNLKAQVGDTLTLDTPSGPLAVRIGGVITHFTSPRGTIMLSRELYERFWHDPKVTRAFVQTVPGAKITTIRTEIGRELGRKYGLRILSCPEIVDYFASQVRIAFAGLYVLAGLVLLVVVVGISDTLAAGVIERTREIGSIRVVGVPRGFIQRMVLLEGGALAALGVALAAGVGLALGTLWVEATFPYLFGWVVELHFPYGYVLQVALLTLAACLGAAYLPSRRAAALQPATALRYE
jgi:putative ABC transport system permease protein